MVDAVYFLLHRLGSLLDSLGRGSEATATDFILVRGSAAAAAEGEGALLCEVALVSLEGTVHHALVRSEWVRRHLLCRHVLLGGHVLQRRCHQAVSRRAALGVLSRQKVVDESSLVACQGRVVECSRHRRMTASPTVMSI